MSLSVNKTTAVQPEDSTTTVRANPTVKNENQTAVVSFSKDKNNLPVKTGAVVAEDPFNEGRKVLAPTGKSNGRNFYFLYTLEGPQNVIAMRTPNKLMVQDDIAKLRSKGYTVIIDNKTTTDDWKNAAYDQKAFGIVALGHGGEGALVTVSKTGDPEGDYLTHWDIDSKKVSPNLKMVYLQSCQAGMEEKAWEKAFKTDVIAWTKSVSNIEVIASNGKIAAAGIFPVIGAYFSIQSQLHGKALGDLIKERF
jgi:hypothetical protein